MSPNMQMDNQGDGDGNQSLPPSLVGFVAGEELADTGSEGYEGSSTGEETEGTDNGEDDSEDYNYESGEDSENVEDEGEDGDEDDGEEDEEEEGDEEEEEDEDVEESEDENAEKCPICLLRFSEQDVGTPESCDHMFCFDCIQEWSKNVTTCPVDRSFFTSILVRHTVDGEVVRTVKVEQRQMQEQEEEDPTFCEMCGRSDREDRLLLCDQCDAGYHCECLDPPLEQIPIEEWYCPRCAPEHQNDESCEEEDYFSNLRRGQRSIPRTQISERVLRVIQRERERRELERLSEPSSSVKPKPPSTKRPSAKRRTAGRRKTTKKRTRKKKTTKKKTSKTKYKRKRTTKGRSKRKKSGRQKVGAKKTKRSSSVLGTRTAKDILPGTPKARLAGKLGLCKRRVGQTLPDYRGASMLSGSTGGRVSRFSIRTTPLLLTGNYNSLDSYEMETNGDVAVSRVTSYSSVTRGPILKKPVEKSPAASTGFDLLGSILAGQELLHKPVNEVTIQRDGTLTVANPSSKPSVLKKKISHPLSPQVPTSTSNDNPKLNTESSSSQYGRSHSGESPERKGDGNTSNDNTGASQTDDQSNHTSYTGHTGAEFTTGQPSASNNWGRNDDYSSGNFADSTHTWNENTFDDFGDNNFEEEERKRKEKRDEEEEKFLYGEEQNLLYGDEKYLCGEEKTAGASGWGAIGWSDITTPEEREGQQMPSTEHSSPRSDRDRTVGSTMEKYKDIFEEEFETSEGNQEFFKSGSSEMRNYSAGQESEQRENFGKDEHSFLEENLDVDDVSWEEEGFDGVNDLHGEEFDGVNDRHGENLNEAEWDREKLNSSSRNDEYQEGYQAENEAQRKRELLDCEEEQWGRDGSSQIATVSSSSVTHSEKIAHGGQTQEYHSGEHLTEDLEKDLNSEVEGVFKTAEKIDEPYGEISYGKENDEGHADEGDEMRKVKPVEEGENLQSKSSSEHVRDEDGQSDKIRESEGQDNNELKVYYREEQHDEKSRDAGQEEGDEEGVEGAELEEDADPEDVDLEGEPDRDEDGDHKGPTKSKKKRGSSRRKSGKRRHEDSEEEGEVKSDEDGERGRKKKKKGKSQKSDSKVNGDSKKKDKRRVVIDKQKTVSIASSIESNESKSKSDNKSDHSDHKEKGTKGKPTDLRHVIKVKRDSHTRSRSRETSSRHEEDYESREHFRERWQGDVEREWDRYPRPLDVDLPDYDYRYLDAQWSQMDYYERERHWENMRVFRERSPNPVRYEERVVVNRSFEEGRRDEPRKGFETARERLRRERLEAEALKKKNTNRWWDPDGWKELDREIEVRRLKFKEEMEKEEKERRRQMQKGLEKKRDDGRRRRDSVSDEMDRRERERSGSEVRKPSRRETERPDLEIEWEPRRRGDSERKGNVDRRGSPRWESERRPDPERADVEKRVPEKKVVRKDVEKKSKRTDKEDRKTSGKKEGQKKDSGRKVLREKSNDREDLEYNPRPSEKKSSTKKVVERQEKELKRKSSKNEVKSSKGNSDKERQKIKPSKENPEVSIIEKKVVTIVLDSSSDEEDLVEITPKPQEKAKKKAKPEQSAATAKDVPLKTGDAEKPKKKKKLKTGKGKKLKKGKTKVGKKKTVVSKRPLSFDVEADMGTTIPKKKKKKGLNASKKNVVEKPAIVEVPPPQDSPAAQEPEESPTEGIQKGISLVGDYKSPVRSPLSEGEIGNSGPEVPLPQKGNDEIKTDAIEDLYDPFEPTASPPLSPTPKTLPLIIDEKKEDTPPPPEEPPKVHTPSPVASPEEEEEDEVIEIKEPPPAKEMEKKNSSKKYNFTHDSDYSLSPDDHETLSDIENQIAEAAKNQSPATKSPVKGKKTAEKVEKTSSTSSSKAPSETKSTSMAVPHLTSEATRKITQILSQQILSHITSTTSNLSQLRASQKGTTTSVADSTQSVSSSGSVDLSFSTDRQEDDIEEEKTGDGSEEELDIEGSAVELYNKNSRERYLKKLYHQERVVDEVKLALKPFYQKKDINKDEYKDIMRKAVNQVCHSKNGEINPLKIRRLVEGYVKKFQYYKKHGKSKSSHAKVKTLVNKGKGLGLK